MMRSPQLATEEHSDLHTLGSGSGSVYVPRVNLRSIFSRRSIEYHYFDPSTLSPRQSGIGSIVAGKPQTSLAVPAVYGAVRMISNAVSMMPWQARDIRSDRPVDRQPAIVRRPDPGNPVSITKQSIISALLLHGESFVFLTGHTRDGHPTIGIPIDNSSVTIRWNPNRTRPIYEINGSEVTLWRDLLHIKFLGSSGDLHGLGPIQMARVSMAGAVAAESMATEQWTSGGPPIDGVVTVPGKLTKDEADLHRSQWGALGTTRGPAFLSGGMAFQGTRLSNMDLQFLESRNYSVLDVCRLFGIPPKFLMAELGGSSLSYANNQESYVDLIRNAYQPVADLLEVSFGEAIPSTQYVDTDFSTLLRADIRTRFDTYSIAAAQGILTINEIRKIERLDPLTGGDAVPTTQPETVEALDDA